MRSITAAAIAALAIVAMPSLAHATTGQWVEFGGGGPSATSGQNCNFADSDGVGPGNLISAANGYVLAESTTNVNGSTPDIVYDWDNANPGWSETNPNNTPTDLFAPLGATSPSDALILDNNGNVALQTYSEYLGWQLHSFGLQAMSVAGNEANPFAVSTVSCGNGNYKVEQYNGSSWAQFFNGCAIQVTVDSVTGYRDPWILNAQGTVSAGNPYTGWSQKTTPSGVYPAKIAVLNGDIWALDYSSGHVEEWDYHAGSNQWVDHSSDPGAPNNGPISAGQISISPSGDVFVVTRGGTCPNSSSPPETVWEWYPQTQ